MSPVDPVVFAARIGAILDSLAIPYMVGGSVATSYYGDPRSTLDLDIVIEAGEHDLRALVNALQGDYYIEVDAALDALRHVSTFNAIHFETGMKVDFFIAERRREVTEQFARAERAHTVHGDVSFYSPEDIVIRKLIWFRLGGETSDQQWRDVVGVLRIGDELDHAYLDRAAEAFEVTDLLTRAREDAH